MEEVSVYIEAQVKQQLNAEELQTLAAEFKQYKTSAPQHFLGLKLGNPYFGKDEGLTQPSSVRNILYKVHIKPRFPKKDSRYWQQQIASGKIPSSDHILIYSRGVTNENAYLLLDIFRPDGHKKLLNFSRLEDLKLLADEFRMQF